MSTGRYFFERVALAVPVLLGVTTFTFLLMHLTVGNYVPGLNLQDSSIKPEDIARLRQTLGLDRPLLVQYFDWLGGLLRGDLGRSMLDNVSVASLIGERLPNTIVLALAAQILGVGLAIPVGVVSALRRGSILDKVLTASATAGFAVPQFWFGLIIILFFSLTLRDWGLPALPTGGLTSVDGGDLLDRLAHLVMPATTLGLVYMSVWSRYVRSSLLQVLSQDYVRTARSKGLRERSVVFGHALGNALIPLITLAGLELPRLVSGSLVVEVVFRWPGVGAFAFQRALNYDFPSVMAVTTLVSVMVVFGNLIADLAYGFADPRIRAR